MKIEYSEVICSRQSSILHSFQVSTQLFDIMSGNTEVDHPLCEECTDSLLNQLDQQLHTAERELENYKELMKTLEKQDDFDEEALDSELAQLRIEEKELLEELNKVEQDREKVASDMKGIFYFIRYMSM